MKKCGLYVRVSTLRQADIKEGSLKNQEYLLRQRIEYKNSLEGEDWEVVEVYKEEGRSAKNTTERPEFLRMIEDVKCGIINTVMVTALSRISRSTRDLLEMIETFKRFGVDFISLKEDFDTTTAQGKCFVTIVAALNEFEREQTSERNRASALARAERGLWNGGQLLGYDLPQEKEKKGTLFKNEKEAALVNLCFDTYLQCGSILTTCKTINGKGYRTKEYVTQTGKLHAGRDFVFTSMRHLLTCYAYIGKTEINKRKKHKDQSKLPEEERYKIADAAWEGIVPEEKFHKVQQLLKKNCLHKHNGTTRLRHNYLLNGGLLRCQKCGSAMEGRSGNGKMKKKYYYYICVNRECRFSVSAGEIEGVITDRIREIAFNDGVMEDLVQQNNNWLRVELPSLYKRRRLQAKELEKINTTARMIMDHLLPEGGGPGAVFIREELDKLGKKREEIEGAVKKLDRQIERIEKKAVQTDLLQERLRDFDKCFGKIKPYQQRELMKLVVGRAELGEESIKIGLNHLSDDLALLYDQAQKSSERGVTRALRHQSGGHDGCPRAWLIWDILALSFRLVGNGHRKIFFASA